MIKVLKLQKAVVVLILGVIALIVFQVMRSNELDSSIYALELAGFLFITGALMLLYPILFSRKDKGGTVQLDPEKPVAEKVEEQNP